jgi:hypothetical protein
MLGHLCYDLSSVETSGALAGGQVKIAKPHKSRDAYLVISVMLASGTVVASVGSVS